MKKLLVHTVVFLFFFTLILGAGGYFLPISAHAQGMPHTFTPSTQTTNSATSQKDPGATTILGNIVGSLVAPVAILFLKIISLVTGLSGIVLNYVINHTVVEISKNYGDIKAINTAWSTIRDVANMGFIFVLLFASIQLILGNGKDTRKLIVNMIIAALLINFSLFFTKVVIDASNILALTFYNAIVPTGPSGVTDILGSGLSNALMEPLKLASIWNMSGGLNPSNLATIGVLGSIVSLIAAFVFFAIAIMFIIRYVVLIFVLILSPIAFVSGVIPGLDSYSKQWKDALFGQAFFAPIYMLLTWITVLIFQNLPGVNTTQSFADALAGTVSTVGGKDVMVHSPSAVSLLFNFVVVIVFLILTLVISKSISDKAGGVVKKITGSALGFAGNQTFGRVGALGRSTLGAFGADVANNEELKKKAVASSLGGMAARLQLAAGRKAAGATFDLRGTTLGDNLDAGKAQGKDGFTQDQKDRAKEYEKYKPGKKTTDAAENAEKDAKKAHEEAKASAEAKFNLDTARQASLKAAEKEHERAKEAVSSTIIPGSTAEKDARASRLAEAETKLKAEQEKTVAQRAQFVDESTVKERTAHGKAEEANKGVKNRLETMAEKAERKVNIFGFNVPIPGGKARAAAIRDAARVKSKKEKADEANAEYAREEFENQEKAKRDAESAPEPEPKKPEEPKEPK